MRSITVVVPKLSNVGGGTGKATSVVGNEQMLELLAGVVAVRKRRVVVIVARRNRHREDFVAVQLLAQVDINSPNTKKRQENNTDNNNIHCTTMHGMKSRQPLAQTVVCIRCSLLLIMFRFTHSLSIELDFYEKPMARGIVLQSS